jgi:oligopeptide/dipeptide ABC transporter ATP-binding protein
MAGLAEELYASPLHPYSRALLDAVPRADPSFVRQPVVSGEVPSLLDPPPGCSFHPRCRFAFERCRVEVPRLREAGADRRVACHLNEGTESGAEVRSPQ